MHETKGTSMASTTIRRNQTKSKSNICNIDNKRRIMGKNQKNIHTIIRRRLYKKDGKIILRTSAKKDKEIAKTLAYNGKRWNKYGTIPPAWTYLGGKIQKP